MSLYSRVRALVCATPVPPPSSRTFQVSTDAQHRLALTYTRNALVQPLFLPALVATAVISMAPRDDGVAKTATAFTIDHILLVQKAVQLTHEYVCTHLIMDLSGHRAIGVSLADHICGFW